MRPRTVLMWTCALLAVVVLVPALVSRSASAAHLHVSASPIQVWRLAAVAPGIPAPDSTSTYSPSSSVAGTGPVDTSDQDHQPRQPNGGQESTESLDESEAPAGDAAEEPPADLPGDQPSPSGDQPAPSESASKGTNESTQEKTPPVDDATPSAPAPDLTTCGDVTQYDEVVLGTPGDDTLSAGPGRQVLVGLGGDDVLKGGDGEDCLLGGAGDDVLVGNPDEDDLAGGAGVDGSVLAGVVSVTPLEDVSLTPLD